MKENVSRLIARSPENMRACEYVSPTHISWKLPRECEDLRALTDAEHALTSVAAFCHFYGPGVPKIWPLSTAKRNTLVSKTRKHDTTEKARSEGPRSHIIRLSYNPSSARSSVHECVSSQRDGKNSELFVYLPSDSCGFRAGPVAGIVPVAGIKRKGFQRRMIDLIFPFPGSFRKFREELRSAPDSETCGARVVSWVGFIAHSTSDTF